MKTLLSRLSLLALAALAPVVPANSQDVVYSEGFESGLGAWTAAGSPAPGLWRLLDSSEPCATAVAPFVEGTKCAWYGKSPTCNYETNSANSGTLTLNDWITLPVAPSISLHWWMWIQSEYCFADSYYNLYDVFSVTITRESGGSLTQQQCQSTQAFSTLLPWHERQIDISAYAGARVKITFSFGTGDQLSNGFLGWLVDDIRILAEPGSRICPSGGLNSGCPCGPTLPGCTCVTGGLPVAGGCRNSTGQSATLFTMGTASVSADTIQLRAEHMPPVASAILTQANGTGTPIVFVDGIRCISGGLLRMGAVVASGGVGTWPLPGESISVRGMLPAAGATKYYYVYYRDVQNFCTPSTANLTDTRRIIWGP